MYNNQSTPPRNRQSFLLSKKVIRHLSIRVSEYPAQKENPQSGRLVAMLLYEGDLGTAKHRITHLRTRSRALGYSSGIRFLYSSVRILEGYAMHA
jgi:hypothetical protein